MNVHFEINQKERFCILQFTIKNGALDPSILQQLQAPDPVQNQFAHKGVILSGRGPIWLYGFLVHYYHPTRWVATYDPRLQAAVVVESHDPAVGVGDLIAL